MGIEMLAPMTTTRWTKATSPQVEALRQTGVLPSWLDGSPHADIHVGDRELLAVNGRSGAVVWCEGSVAKLPFAKGAKSIPGMQRGMTATVNDRSVRIWRPRFGLTLRSRALRVKGDETAWAIIPEGL